MRYINRRTGAVIDACCQISGGDWEPVPEEGAGDQKPVKTEEAPKKRRTTTKK